MNFRPLFLEYATINTSRPIYFLSGKEFHSRTIQCTIILMSTAPPNNYLAPIPRQPQTVAKNCTFGFDTVNVALLNIRSLGGKSFLIHAFIIKHILYFMFLTETLIDQVTVQLFTLNHCVFFESDISVYTNTQTETGSKQYNTEHTADMFIEAFSSTPPVSRWSLVRNILLEETPR